jgi:hypothetical protein
MWVGAFLGVRGWWGQVSFQNLQKKTMKNETTTTRTV